MPEERRRPRVMWFALPWLAISLPLLTSLRLRLEFPYDSDSAFDGALALADAGGPYIAVLAFWFGLRPRRREGASSVLDQGSGPMLILLSVALLSMALLIPFDIVSTRGPWRRIQAWIGAAALPLWAVSLLLRDRGASRRIAAASALGLVALLVAGSVTAGSLLLLDPWAQLLPLAAAGGVAAFGCVLAAWERVTASTTAVLAGTAVLSLSVALGAAWRVSSPPMASGQVVGVGAIDPGGERAVVAVLWPNVEPVRMAEIDLRQGTSTLLPPLTRQVRYAAGVRVSVRLGRLAYALGRSGPALICREDSGDGEVCGPALAEYAGTVLAPHPRLPKVLGSWHDRFVVWDLETGRSMHVERAGERLRWPCFDTEGGVIWRIQQADGPFLHERLTPKGDVVPLAIGHRHHCMEETPQPPAARFERGRTTIGKVSTLQGDALPEGTLDLPGTVQLMRWSKDGQTAAMYVEEGPDRYSVRFWTAAGGLSGPIAVDGLSNLLVDGAGRYVSWMLPAGRGRLRYEVHAVPGGKLVDAGPAETGAMAWSDDERLLIHQAGRLLWRDPVRRVDEILFPREPEQTPVSRGRAGP